MATITPQWTRVSDTITEVLWEACATGDTILRIAPPTPLCSISMSGTWGSATAKMVGTNDGSTLVDINDTDGTAVSLTANGGFNPVAVMWEEIGPSLSGGSSDDVDILARFVAA